MNLTNTLLIYLFKIHFNTILSSTPRSSNFVGISAPFHLIPSADTAKCNKRIFILDLLVLTHKRCIKGSLFDVGFTQILVTSSTHNYPLSPHIKSVQTVRKFQRTTESLKKCAVTKRENLWRNRVWMERTLYFASIFLHFRSTDYIMWCIKYCIRHLLIMYLSNCNCKKIHFVIAFETSVPSLMAQRVNNVLNRMLTSISILVTTIRGFSMKQHQSKKNIL
jgi:hypothetical protein